MATSVILSRVPELQRSIPDSTALIRCMLARVRGFLDDLTLLYPNITEAG